MIVIRGGEGGETNFGSDGGESKQKMIIVKRQ